MDWTLILASKIEKPEVINILFQNEGLDFFHQNNNGNDAIEAAGGFKKTRTNLYKLQYRIKLFHYYLFAEFPLLLNKL